MGRQYVAPLFFTEDVILFRIIHLFLGAVGLVALMQVCLQLLSPEFSWVFRDLGTYHHIGLNRTKSLELLLHVGGVMVLMLYFAIAGYFAGSKASILINNTEYSLDSRGLNIVVFDKYLNKVIDSVAINTYLPEHKIIRIS